MMKTRKSSQINKHQCSATLPFEIAYNALSSYFCWSLLVPSDSLQQIYSSITNHPSFNDIAGFTELLHILFYYVMFVLVKLVVKSGNKKKCHLSCQKKYNLLK